MDATELKYHRLNTEAFISQKPTVVTLTPQTKQETASGGYKLVPGVTKSAQTVRVIELGMNQSPPILINTDGKQRVAEFWLLGAFNSDIQINDYWVAEDGREWVVGDVVRSNQYEVRGLVTERGK